MANSVYYTYMGEAANKLDEAGLVEEANKLRVSIAERHRLRKQEQAESQEGRRMIEEIQAQQRKEENEVANYMIKDIQAQQKLARQLMYKAETRTRKKPPPSRRQLNRKAQKPGPVFRGYNALLGEHLVNKQSRSKPYHVVPGPVFRGYNALLESHLGNRQSRVEVRQQLAAIQKRKTQKKTNTKTNKKKEYTL